MKQQLGEMKMANVNLRMVHSKQTQIVPFEQLKLVSMPVETDTYKPIAHQTFVEMVRVKLAENNMIVAQELHGLWRNGLRYFGLLQVLHADLQHQDMAFVIGLRSSLDKSLPLSIAAGNSVFVCDNLAFNSEIVLGRRHTKYVMNDLMDNIGRAVLSLHDKWKDHLRRVDHYKTVGLSNLQANDLIVRAFNEGILDKTQVAELISQWYAPNHAEFKERNFWSFQNAFTEVFKGRADLIQERCNGMHKLLDSETNFTFEVTAK